MKIDGKTIADKIYEQLKTRTQELKNEGINPHIVVILIGEDPGSVSYVQQKKKWSEFIGIRFSLIHYQQNVSQEEVEKAVDHLNNDRQVHGIIIQRPVPKHFNQGKLLKIISSKKDIDGFHPDSPFEVPVAQAVWRLLEEVYTRSNLYGGSTIAQGLTFTSWLMPKNIVVIGRGETAGGPIISLLQKKNLNPTVIDSKTPDPQKKIQKGDIVISAVGKPGVLDKNSIKQGAILIGVGLRKDDFDSLKGDYYEQDIVSTASFYTPTPGGVGPVNVAYLLTNVIEAAEKYN